MRLIENIVKPDYILLYWNASQGEDRMRRCVAKVFEKEKILQLEYLNDSDDFKEAKNLGFKGFPGLKIEIQKHSHVEEQFYKRIPSRKRNDFNRFLEANRVSPDSGITDFELLGYSGAKLPGDNFSFIHPFNTAKRPFEILAEVSGFRFRKNNLLDILKIGDPVKFAYEPDNEKDEKAIKILFNNHHLGYISRGILSSFKNWYENDSIFSATIERINGTKDKPRLYIFLEIK